MNFEKILKPEQNLVRILLKLYEEGTLTRSDAARTLDAEFPHVLDERYRSILRKVDEYARVLEKNGLIRRAWYKGRDYTLILTERGMKEASRLMRVER